MQTEREAQCEQLARMEFARRPGMADRRLLISAVSQEPIRVVPPQPLPCEAGGVGSTEGSVGFQLEVALSGIQPRQFDSSSCP